MRRMVLCCALLASGGCSLLLSTSDFAEQVGPDGGGTSPTEAGDALPGPGPEPDTGAGDAGTTDGPVVFPDAGTRFCAALSPAPKFCADFDGDAGVDEGWGAILVDPPNAGSAARDPLGRDRSSLLTKQTITQTCSYVRLGRSFVTTGKGLRTSFSFRPSSPWNGDAIFSLIKLDNGGNGCAILYHFDPSDGASVHLQFGQPEQNAIFAWDAQPKVDVWSRIETALSSTGTMTVNLDGAKVIAMQLPDECTFGDGIHVAPGFHCEDDPHEARFDDVVVDYP